MKIQSFYGRLFLVMDHANKLNKHIDWRGLKVSVYIYINVHNNSILMIKGPYFIYLSEKSTQDISLTHNYSSNKFSSAKERKYRQNQLLQREDESKSSTIAWSTKSFYVSLQ